MAIFCRGFSASILLCNDPSDVYKVPNIILYFEEVRQLVLRYVEVEDPVDQVGQEEGGGKQLTRDLVNPRPRGTVS